MLVEFRVKNFRSFRDEQVLSMVASERDKNLPENCVKVGKHTLLKAAAIYGANASGKSNLVRAMGAFASMVNRGNIKDPGPRVLLTPFLLSKSTPLVPCFFEIAFYASEELYRYGFEATAEHVTSEWLYAYPKGRSQKWFHRLESDVMPAKNRGGFGRGLKGDLQALLEKTRPDTLFLAVAGEFNHPQLREIWDHLRYNFRSIVTGDVLAQVTEKFVHREMATEGPHTLKSFVERHLQKADLGINSLDISRIESDEITFPDYVSEDVQKRLRTRFKDEPLFDVRLGHVGEKGERFTLSIEDESDGTRRFFELLGPLWQTTAEGLTIMVDELEKSLHPLLSRELVRLVLSEKTNKSGAQLIFTTHDVTLLDPTLFRRDQIWFTEKDKDGATSLYPLSDFKERGNAAFQRGYLSGRYGAIPIIEAFDDYDS
jgi:hypothetical protein